MQCAEHRHEAFSEPTLVQIRIIKNICRYKEEHLTSKHTLTQIIAHMSAYRSIYFLHCWPALFSDCLNDCSHDVRSCLHESKVETKHCFMCVLTVAQKEIYLMLFFANSAKIAQIDGQWCPFGRGVDCAEVPVRFMRWSNVSEILRFQKLWFKFLICSCHDIRG